MSNPSRNTARTTQGILGEKLGMTQVFDANNRIVPVTVVKAGPCVVTQIRTPDKDGYSAVQLAYGAVDPRRVNKPEGGHFAKAGVPPRRYLLEIRTADASSYTLGQEITADLFAPDGDKPVKVDVVGTSKGKGYAGVMKRHNFRGLGAGHGVQRKHRSPGSIGACATPGRVFKGTRMAGRMGHVKTTTQNLTVHAVDAEKGLILIKGALPGPTGGLVLIKTAVKNGLAKGGVPR
ncbi:MAG: 50S ribosomal protein L3 [Actinomycetota bacterium]|nr:50S ribosomal protein L3 [Actinomycetota bacterium]